MAGTTSRDENPKVSHFERHVGILGPGDATEKLYQFEIGDMGYFKGNVFYRLFNIHQLEDRENDSHWKLAGPHDAHRARGLIMPRFYGTSRIKAKHGGLEVALTSLNTWNSIVNGPIEFFCTEGERGAVIHLQGPVLVDETDNRSEYQDHIQKYAIAWIELAKRRDEHYAYEDIILISGGVYARHWTLASFPKDTGIALTFGENGTILSWTNGCESTVTRSSPSPPEFPAEGMPCIFVRGFTVTARAQLSGSKAETGVEESPNETLPIWELFIKTLPSIPVAHNDNGQCHLTCVGFLSRFGDALEEHFLDTKDLFYLNASIGAHQKAIQFCPPGSETQTSLSLCISRLLGYRFSLESNEADADLGLVITQRALDSAPANDPCRPGLMCALSFWLLQRFERRGNLVDIDASILNHGERIDLTPDDEPGKSHCLKGLAHCLRYRYDVIRDIRDIDKAIARLQQAASLARDETPSQEGPLGDPAILCDLGIALRVRFESGKRVADLDAAIEAHTMAMDLVHEGDPLMCNALGGLGVAFLTRFQHSGYAVDIDSAVAALQNSVKLSEGKPPSHLNNLALAHTLRFTGFGQYDSSKIPLAPDGRGVLEESLSALDLSSWRRLNPSGDVADIDEAIRLQERALSLTSDHLPEKTAYLYNQAHLYEIRYRHFGEDEDLDRTIALFYEAMSNRAGSPVARVRAASHGADAHYTRHHTHDLEAHRVAMELIPSIVWMGRPLEERYKATGTVQYTAIHAAAAAIDSQRLDLALEWLEVGRNIVWSQILSLRTPLDDLREADPELAGRLGDVFSALDHSGPSTEIVASSSSEVMVEREIQTRHRLAEEKDGLLEQARRIPGFERFMLPKRFSKLRAAARSGPVVVINAESERYTALIVRDNEDSIIEIPLPNLTRAHLVKLSSAWLMALEDSGIYSGSQRGLKRKKASSSGPVVAIERILGDLWTNVVKPILDAILRAYPQDEGKLLHVTWCPTGLLSVLPIHAAGLYAQDKTSRVFKHVVSSYAPSLSAILAAQRPRKPGSEGILVVSQPSTPGYTPLPQTTHEAQNVLHRTSHMPSSWLNGEHATTSSVLTELDRFSWIHLACHGIQDPRQATNSGFQLQDGRLTLSALTRKNLPHADFAFLSACETAMGDVKRSEEVIHMAAGMLAVGYRSVVATMWSIRDKDAVRVADDVYAFMMRDEHPNAGGEANSTSAAYALHEAVGRLRETVGERNFLSWMPFIHMGI